MNPDTLKCVIEIDKCQSLFVTLKGVKRYGFDQHYYDEVLEVEGGCGPVTVLNYLHFLERAKEYISIVEPFKGKTGMEKMYLAYQLFPPLNFTKKSSKTLVKNIPGTIGIQSFKKFVRYIYKYCKDYNINFVPKLHALGFYANSRERFIQDIKEQLKHGLPVPFLNTFTDCSLYTFRKNRAVKQSFKYHWVLITGIYENEDRTVIKVMTWGQEGFFYLDEFSKRTFLDYLFPTGYVKVIDNDFQIEYY